mmetsp:Transcript_17499/g.33985  ORF Transcript_17499/g.33985 Transcript_17499/m.33985 type:complete len:305 (+) Transcript_17499:3-917(+)
MLGAFLLVSKSSPMATRNWTKRFNELRSSFGIARSSQTQSFGSAGYESHSKSHSSTTATSLPPEYIDFVELIELDEQAIIDSVKKLKHLHSRRLKVTFGGDEKDRDQEINDISHQIQTLLARSEKNLKKIASVGNNGNISTEDRICRLNIMRSYARRLQNLSRDFKAAQREFVGALKGQQKFGQDFFGETVGAERSRDGYEREQQAVLMEEEEKAREAEIDELLQSIGAIQSLFKELSVLVIDQGSVLDRIDYNCESVLVKAKEGRKEMEKANEHSKNNRSLIIILCLTGMMIVLLIIVAMKFS